MTMFRRLSKLSIMLVVGVSLSACSGTDVELKGGLFELAGLTGTAGARKEPELKDRVGIVVPPSAASLPPPRDPNEVVAAANGEAFPVDPEDARKARLADVAARHKAFCDKARERYEAGLTPTLENSEWGACHESILRNFTGKDIAGNKAVGSQ